MVAAAPALSRTLGVAQICWIARSWPLSSTTATGWCDAVDHGRSSILGCVVATLHIRFCLRHVRRGSQPSQAMSVGVPSSSRTTVRWCSGGGAVAVHGHNRLSIYHHLAASRSPPQIGAFPRPGGALPSRCGIRALAAQDDGLSRHPLALQLPDETESRLHRDRRQSHRAARAETHPPASAHGHRGDGGLSTLSQPCVPRTARTV